MNAVMDVQRYDANNSLTNDIVTSNTSVGLSSCNSEACSPRPHTCKLVKE